MFLLPPTLCSESLAVWRRRGTQVGGWGGQDLGSWGGIRPGSEELDLERSETFIKGSERKKLYLLFGGE